PAYVVLHPDTEQAIHVGYGAISMQLFYHDLIPNALRWPARFVIPVLVFMGLSQSLWKMRGRALHEWFWRPFLNPIPMIAVFMWFSYQVRESFPLSHYPMYSDPQPIREYQYVAGYFGEELKPLPITNLTRITVFKVRRMYRSRRDLFRKANELKLDDLTYDHKKIFGTDVLEYLQGEATRHGIVVTDEVPKKWALIEVTVTYDFDTEEFNEAEKVIATRELP
ncbi:MAG: hypothetical protein AAF585_29660, partial [Verrucomicrobiota bacterium]